MRGWILSAILLGASLGALPGLGAEPPIGSLELLGTARLPFGTAFEGTLVGGLSGLTYDPELGLYYALSDDPSRRAPSRFYTLRIDLAERALDPHSSSPKSTSPTSAPAVAKLVVEIEGVTLLRGRDGETFGERIIDGEGIALTPQRTLLISSEGNINRGTSPSIREFRLDGRELHEYHLPNRWLPRKDEPHGVRHNQAFEAMTIFPGGQSFVTATENALLQDGPETDVGQDSRVRISRLDRRSGKLEAEHVYVVEPVVAAPVTADAFRTNGLVELIALTETELLALERSFSLGVGNSIRLYLISTANADDVSRLSSLAGRANPRPVAKRLLIDFANLDISPDNVEGMALGPRLEDGRRVLALVSDDNFSPLQTTQIFAFAVATGETPIGAIQGAGHRSPLEGRWIAEATGVVTATDLESRRPGFWLQARRDDGDPDTSDGVFVSSGELAGPVSVGDLVSVGGRVVEAERPGQLPVTQINALRVEILDHGVTLPDATRLGTGGRPVPETIDDDGLGDFQPDDDAIDLYESLEGMRVSVEAATVVGPTTRFGTLTVAVPGGMAARTLDGGLLLAANDFNSERLVVDGSLIDGLADVEVGRKLAAPVGGVLDYAFGNYRLLATSAVELDEPRESRLNDTVGVDLDRLSVMTFNVENLDFGDSEEKFHRVAGLLAVRRPDVVALQEIQDDSGDDDDGTVTAAATLGRLTEAVRSLDGPSYDFAQIDPDDNADGGAPGGNIRVAFLYDHKRVSLIGGESLLSANPARLFVDSAAFSEDPESGFEATRKPLAAEFSFAGRRLVMINVHLKSKRGDDRIFGSIQPPVPWTETQRLAQARELGVQVDALLERDPELMILVLGDFNDHEFRPPLRLLAEHALNNLIERVPAESRYTYNYEGSSQVLDHVLISPALDRCDPRTEIVHANADLPDPRRSSDHDPVLASFDLRCRVN